VIRLLKALTFVDLEQIFALEKQMKQPGYVPNTAQRLLAEEVTRLVHGEEGLQRALKTTQQALPGQESVVFSATTIHEMKEHLPTKELPKASVVGVRVCDVLANCLFVPSKADGRRLIKNGGLLVNNRKVSDEFEVITEEDLVEGQYVVFSLGKKNRVVLEVT
jgi:tyrosyl-tRNA synthetase